MSSDNPDFLSDEYLAFEHEQVMQRLLSRSKKEIRESLKNTPDYGGKIISELNDFMVRRMVKMHFKEKRKRRERRHQK